MSREPIPEEIQKAYDALRRNHLDFALLSSLPNVTYTSGWDVPPVMGAAADLTGWLPNALVLLSARDETAWLVVSDLLAAPAKLSNRLDQIEVFGGFGHFEPVDVEATFSSALRNVLQAAGVTGRATLGVEFRSLPLIAQRVIAHELPGLELQDARPSLEEARRIKTPREIGLIREAVAVADAAQNALMEQAQRSGQSDIDVWDALAGAMERKTGGVVTNVAEIVTGSRTAKVAPGGPVGRIVESGDTGLLDISPRVKGYWADCTNTVVFGCQPSAEQRRYFDAAREACEAGIGAIRPGARACDVEAAIRSTFERHGFPVAHYSGHQIGAGLNETPRIVPYDTSTMEAGMVFAVEPGAYAGEGGTTGARAEKMVLVTESGHEVLSTFKWGM